MLARVKPFTAATLGFAAAAGLFAFSSFKKAAANSGARALDEKQFQPFTVSKIEKLNYNTNVYTFQMPDQKPMPVSSFVLAKPNFTDKDGKAITRPYTPLDQSNGELKLLVKVYENGTVSKYFGQLKVGDSVELKGPLVKWAYKPNSKKEIGMIAGGTGITPMLQIIDAINSNPEDKTKVTLLFCNNSEQDVVLQEQLAAIAKKNPNVKVVHQLWKPTESWTGLKGIPDADTLKKLMPTPSDENVVLICGPPGMMKHVSGAKAPDYSQGEVDGLLKELGYAKSQIFKL